MSTVYAVFQECVYRHGCFGVFSSESAAREAAKEAAFTDIDSHHFYQVVPFELDSTLAFDASNMYPVEKEPVFETNKYEEDNNQ